MTTPPLPRRFHLERTQDVTGASGTGYVADGIRWADGSASVRWLGDRPSIVFWASMDDAVHVHTHAGGTDTRIVWNEPEPLGWDGADTTCPHCPDGHTPPEHGQPWGAWVGPERDGDGQPTTIHVARAAGAHVAESDAQWVRNRLNYSR
jgi:hypothetical protein